MAAPSESLILSIAHVNLSVPPGTLDQAKTFYTSTLGFTARPVPPAQVESVAWFDIASSGQQIHISYPEGPAKASDTNNPAASRHPCFKLASRDALVAVQQRILNHIARGGPDAPMACDAVGTSSGAQGVEYPTRFFARDFAGNRLEFSL
jgi:catechol 2,3-dioxygenase-like lactoylglutathione lyase family enzyme